MQPPARARRVLSALGLAAISAACSRAVPPPAPSIPWLVEVTSIDGEGGLSRCVNDACAQVTSRALIARGSLLRTGRGARATLAAGEDVTLDLGPSTEAEMQAEGADHAVTLRSGRLSIERPESAGSAAHPLVVQLGERSVIVKGTASIDVRSEGGDGECSVIVQRGEATLRDEAATETLATGQGARWTPGKPVTPYARWAADEDEETAREAPASGAPRGLGTMTARVPGTEEIVSGVRLASHHVAAEVRDGFARTTVEEEFENETARTLEGRFVFPLPPDASVSRLALWVKDDLVEGEVVEKPLASRVFKAIVDDTVRPRDPAILEMKEGSTVALKVFPIPPKGRRRVLLTYDQSLAERGERVRYVYPLSLGADRATTIDDFAVAITVKDSAATLGAATTAGYDASLHVDEQGLVASYAAKKFAPTSDFVLRYSRTETDAASLSWSMGPKEVAAREASRGAPAGYFALRLRADAPPGSAKRAIARPARVLAIDTSHSQAADTIDAEVRVVQAALAGMDPEDRFAVLACDSACESYPDDGLARAGDEAIASASRWLKRRGAAGSSDLAGSLLAAADRLSSEGGGQVVYIGDGVATSGELGVQAIAARVAPAFRGIDAHFVGVGHGLDEGALSAIAGAVSGTYERFATGDAVADRAAAIARTIDAPVLRDAKLVLPDGAFDVLPSQLPRVRMGQEIQVFGRFRLPAEPKGETVPASLPAADAEPHAKGALREARLTGDVDGARYQIVRSLDWGRAIASPSPAVHALWARAKIASLESAGTDEATKEIVRLSTVHHVLSRATAMLVLENERMFVETGVRAAIDRVLASDPAGDGSPRGAPVARSASGASRASSARSAEPFGILGALQNSDAPSEPWGHSALDPARGNMWGSDIGSSFGAGGLGLSGIGEGGGGRGEGIGLGSVGTIGHGSGVGSSSSSSFGSGHGRLAGEHSASAPKVRSGAASVSGRLPPEVIQRIVRQQFGRFRACYEVGLRTNPDLQGRVSIRFVIDANGSVTTSANGGSDLSDASVVSCVVAAVRGLTFPQPEGGVVTVVYPINFAPGDAASSASSSSTSSAPSAEAPSAQPAPSSSAPQTWSSHGRSQPLSTDWSHPVGTSWPRWAPNPPPDSPVVVHRAPDEAPAPGDDAALAKILAQAAAPEASRSAHQAAVRKLLARGRFDDAFAEASRYVALDPDHETALELYAEAAAATGRPRVAVMAVDAQVESDPSRVIAHRRAAAAFEATGDERRACAHFRALASLPGADDAAAYHALRCRARLGERSAVLTEARAIPKPGALVTKLIEALEHGSAPPFEPTASAGPFDVRVACHGEAAECPAPIVVGPTGRVLSPWTPAAPCSRGEIALASVTSGTYRTLITGDLPSGGAEVTVRVLGQSKTVQLTRTGTQTILATSVTLPDNTPSVFN
ncbi:MAG: AgmX/PglI C-terminal domain-containing protein [Polyangiaceae bacterium]